MLDIKMGLQELRFVKKVFVVSVDDEVKELLFLCRSNFHDEPEINAVNLKRNETETFSFKFSEEANAIASFSGPKTFLYEPYSSILKAGAFKSIAVEYRLEKFEKNTQLYTSTDLVQNFPGRIFKIISEVKPEKKSLGEFFPEGKANVITRNYPLSVDELKKKTGLKDGGEKYLIGFSGHSKKFVVAAERIK
jgi:alpha-glucuronidase